MKKTINYPAYDSKDYTLYVEFVNAFSAEYPEESIDDITEYFMILLSEKDRSTIHMYIMLYELKKYDVLFS